MKIVRVKEYKYIELTVEEEGMRKAKHEKVTDSCAEREIGKCV
jgi:hypothetical protein